MKDWKLVFCDRAALFPAPATPLTITIGTPYEALYDNAYDFNFRFTLDFNAPTNYDVSVNQASRTTCNILMKRGSTFRNIKQWN